MRCFSLLLVVFLVLPALALAAEPVKTPPEGVLPVGVDGKPLNLDFETGTLKDWTAEGEAFKGQPVKGDAVAQRRKDMKSGHQGDYWIGGYELLQDKAQGTLTSVPFTVTQPWASFLVGGGASPETCVDLVRTDTKEVFSRTSGIEEENMRRVAVDLTALQGKQIFIRLVDKASGPWGHLNFDDFRLHSEKPNVPARAVHGTAPTKADEYKYAGLAPDKAAAAMTVPEGFSVSLFAGEPDVCQPIAFCLDDRGRLWVAEAYSYPVRRADKDAMDRIVVFEDTKGTGHFDKRTVFLEGLNLVSGLEVGFGGVWIGAAPYLMYVPIKGDEDKTAGPQPAGKPQILLDGWHYEDTHETLNAFQWGPDGWLYGCHGVFTHSLVGKPGAPDKDRTPINAGVWRYHPTKHLFEVFAHGTSNPWGLDFDEHGQLFVTACVIPHAYHIVQGGRYQRQAGTHFNPYTYADIPTIADHLHWQGANQWAGNQSSGSKGGGHAHAGLMIYQGGAWPEEYRGRMFMGNLHGHRLNTDILKPKGSGFVASHGPDFLLANDSWARFINLRSGPDGNVYLIDWYDKQACHVGAKPDAWDRSNGRIYKISHRAAKPVVGVDLAKKTDKELVELLSDKNDWYARHAQRLLQERAANKTLDKDTHELLAKLTFGDKDETRRLRGLWALHVTEGLTEESILKGLEDIAPYIRAWSVQLATEDRKPKDGIQGPLARLAHDDQSPVVRLYLASVAERIPGSYGAEVARFEGLYSHQVDAKDPNLPLMYWFAIERLITTWEKDKQEKIALLFTDSVRHDPLREFIVRRVASTYPDHLFAGGLVMHFLEESMTDAERKLILRNTLLGLKGRGQVEKPNGWDPVVDLKELLTTKDTELRSLTYSLGIVFGDTKALKHMREELVSTKTDLRSRQAALTVLLDARDKELAPVLLKLVDEKELRATAIKALATYDDPKTPDVILAAFGSLSAEEKRDALNTLAARPAYGKALMEAVAARKVAANDVPAETVRQLRNLKDKELDQRIGEVWGIVRTTPAARAQLIADWKKKLSAPSAPPDLALGRALFAKTCQQCHTLYGVGGKVGPDITGSNRSNLDYLLENVLDPSAVIPNDYKATLINLKNGRVITGIVRGETPQALTVVTANETLTVPVGEIDTRMISDVSMMPDDLLKPLNEGEIRSLVAYLRNPVQTPMLATKENVKDFFNGKDLTGWDGDMKLWSVENGEIVGKSPGIKKNTFLKSQLVATDFKLTLKIKLVPNKENSGVQFRSEALEDGEMKGPQADAGAGWWGKLYEESGRGVLSDNKAGEKVVKVDDWNDYVIIAEGSKIKTYLNGQLCVDLDDEKISRRGIFGLQIHAGGAMEVRFKDIKLEVLGK